MTEPEDQASPVGRPRWVKTFAIVAAVLFALLVVLMLVGGHGPGDHSGLARLVGSS